MGYIEEIESMVTPLRKNVNHIIVVESNQIKVDEFSPLEYVLVLQPNVFTNLTLPRSVLLPDPPKKVGPLAPWHQRVVFLIGKEEKNFGGNNNIFVL